MYTILSSICDSFDHVNFNDEINSGNEIRRVEILGEKYVQM